MIALAIFFLIFFGVFVFGSLAYLFMKREKRALQTMFRAYNEQKDLAVITTWVRQKKPATRMLQVQEYLQDAEMLDLSIKVYEALADLNFQHRHILVFACRACLETEHELAVSLSEGLLNREPDDDTAIDLFVDAHLTFGHIEKARNVLDQRLTRKFKGTMFARYKARLLAYDGHLDQAIETMEKVVKRDKTLAENTFAQPQKRLIAKQYHESRRILAEFQERRAGVESPASDKETT